MASSLNRAMLIGNLTRDPEVRKTPSGQSVANFSIATNRVYTDAAGAKKDQAEYHNIVAWGRLAEICGQYLTKGKKVYIDGRLQTREWDGQDGQKKYRTEIVAENMIMLGAPGAGGMGGGRSEAFSADAADSSVPSEAFAKDGGPAVIADVPSQTPDDEIKLEDIPF